MKRLQTSLSTVISPMADGGASESGASREGRKGAAWVTSAGDLTTEVDHVPVVPLSDEAPSDATVDETA